MVIHQFTYQINIMNNFQWNFLIYKRKCLFCFTLKTFQLFTFLKYFFICWWFETVQKEMSSKKFTARNAEKEKRRAAAASKWQKSGAEAAEAAAAGNEPELLMQPPLEVHPATPSVFAKSLICEPRSLASNRRRGSDCRSEKREVKQHIRSRSYQTLFLRKRRIFPFSADKLECL